MKKKLIGLFLAIVMFSTMPLAIGEQTIQETAIINEDVETTSIIGVTFVAGLIFNPTRIGNRVQAKSLVLVYYDRGLIFKDSGVAVLKNVYFRDGDLLYMSEANSMGLYMIAGICTGFNVMGK